MRLGAGEEIVLSWFLSLHLLGSSGFAGLDRVGTCLSLSLSHTFSLGLGDEFLALLGKTRLLSLQTLGGLPLELLKVLLLLLKVFHLFLKSLLCCCRFLFLFLLSFCQGFGLPLKFGLF